MTMLQQLAIKWRERQAALGYKGKRAEAAVFEYFIGAASALDLAGPARHERPRSRQILLRRDERERRRMARRRRGSARDR
jgi:hypothetical protein